MPLPRFIDIDGRRYLWRDLLELRRTQATPRATQPVLFPLREIIGRRANATPPSVTANPAFSCG
jgi:hypothetical protein